MLSLGPTKKWGPERQSEGEATFEAGDMAYIMAHPERPGAYKITPEK